MMISAILVGTGESKRMGANKLLLPWGRKTVLEHCFDTLVRSKVKEIVFALSDRSQEIRPQLEKRSASSEKRVKVEMNPDYRKGLSTSCPPMSGIWRLKSSYGLIRSSINSTSCPLPS